MIINPYSFGGLDPDAQAFLTASGITDNTISGAINTLVVQMKADNIWTKMKAIYPMVGGSASTHKWNLKDPRDLDAAFRLQYFGGWSHSANGALPNGTNAFADTKLNTSTVLGNNSGSLGYYSRTNSAIVNEIPIGNINGASGTSSFHLVIRRDNNLNSFRATTSGAFVGIVNGTTTDSRGLTSCSITSATSRKLFKNSSLVATDSVSNTWSRANANIYIGAANRFESSTADYYTNKECAFSYISDGLTDTDISNLYTAVQAFQTTLNRQV